MFKRLRPLLRLQASVACAVASVSMLMLSELWSLAVDKLLIPGTSRKELLEPLPSSFRYQYLFDCPLLVTQHNLGYTGYSTHYVVFLC